MKAQKNKRTKLPRIMENNGRGGQTSISHVRFLYTRIIKLLLHREHLQAAHKIDTAVCGQLAIYESEFSSYLCCFDFGNGELRMECFYLLWGTETGLCCPSFQCFPYYETKASPQDIVVKNLPTIDE